MVKAGYDNQFLDSYKQGNSDMRIMSSYLGNDFSLWTCPNVEQTERLEDTLNTSSILRCNYFYYPGNITNDYLTSRKLGEQSPEDCVMSDQSYFWVTGFRNPHMSGGIFFKPFSNNPSFVTFRHGEPEGVNATYADGHGRWFNFSELTEDAATNVTQTTYYIPYLNK